MRKPELEGELHVLRKEKSTLMQEVIKLQQEHLITVQQMDALNQRMQSAGQKQKLMVSFLAKVLQHPVLLAHLKQLKEQRENDSTVRRRFLKQQQRSHNDLDKAMDQQTGKKRLEFTSATSSGLQGIECNVSNQVPDNQDMVEKLCFDTSRGELLSGSVENGLEVLDPLFLDPDSVAIKVELPESSQTDMGFSGTEFFASFPEDVTPERMFSDAIIPVTEFARPDPQTVRFEGKNAVDKTEVTSAGSMCLGPFAAATSQKKMFSDAIASASKTSSNQEGIWNLSLEAGESSWSSCQHVWDSLAQDAIEREVAAGPGALWDIDLQTLDEDLEFDKCLGSDFSHQEHESQAGPANKDHKEKMEP